MIEEGRTEEHIVQERMEADVADAWAKLLQVEAGRWVVHSILESCGVFRSSFIPSQPDSTAFAEGARSIGLEILGQRVMANGSEVFTKMMAEHDARVDRVRIAIEQDNRKESPDV